MDETDVLIVGGGPVGLTLAMDPGPRGVRCLLIDRRDAPGFLPKMERCIYGAGWLLLRPDLHVAWRGDASPPATLARQVTGYG